MSHQGVELYSQDPAGGQAHFLSGQAQCEVSGVWNVVVCLCDPSKELGAECRLLHTHPSTDSHVSCSVSIGAV